MSGSCKLRFLVAQREFPAGVAVASASEGQRVLPLAELQYTHATVSNQHHGLIEAQYRALEMLQHI
ncbi:hypothetical protein M3I53_23495 [Paraburkholderia sp. CNPSo 3272]|uniref:hypothetical protein n=1 Tax=Paraburkholderia sp. CNPSo 3272 TaxID=2940931 RepID=UPI0020B71F6F|nr:hypothetical protein [Paraburkholderia sp. CNPSo 3272]MCP3726056.1 hypothetical protein [Paraburkholderia sp. CNPSo 3272]